MRSEQDRSRDCLRAAGAIEDFGDGHVGRMRWMLLRRHVKECEECGAYFSRMGAVVDALAKLQAVQAPEDFAQLVMSRLLIGLADAAWERSEDVHPAGATSSGWQRRGSASPWLLAWR